MEISRSQLAILLHAVPHLGPKGISRLLEDIPAGLPGDILDLSKLRFWQLSADSLQREYKLHPEAARCLTIQKEELLKASANIVSSASKLGISVLVSSDSDYPASLREYDTTLTPFLYAYGNLGLLRERKFAIVGSSNTGVRGIETMRQLATMLSEKGLTAVTSHNTRPYQVVGLATKSRDASIILVLDRGILCAFPHGLGWEPVAQARIWDIRFDPKRDLVVSKFRLYDPWIGANGRERDRMVFALADIVAAVEIRSGGVMEAECLRAHAKGREVYVYQPEDMEIPAGNRTLLEKGCSPMPSDWAQSMIETLDLPLSAEIEEE